MARTACTALLVLGLSLFQDLSLANDRTTPSTSVLDTLKHPVAGEVEATLGAAVELRNNLVNTLGAFLEYPYLRISNKYWSALKDIYDGVRLRRISMVDIVMDIQKYKSKRAEDQFLGVLSRLENTVSCRYVCQVRHLQEALKTLELTLDEVLKNTTQGIFQNVPQFTKDQLGSLWFSKLSDRVKTFLPVSCDRQSSLQNAILEGLRKKYIPLNTNVFALLLLNLEYPAITPYGLEKIKYVATSLLKLSPNKELDVELQRCDFQKHRDLYSLLRGILKFMKMSPNIQDHVLRAVIGSAAEHVIEDPIRRPISLISEDYNVRESGLLNLNGLFKVMQSKKFPPDVLEAASIIQKDIVKGYVYKLPIVEQQRLYYQYSDPLALLLAILERIRLGSPDSSSKLPIIKSLVVHVRHKFCKENGIECSPRSKEEVMHLLESFGTLALDVKYVKMTVDLMMIFSRKNLEWESIMNKLSSNQFSNPRLIFLNIVHSLLKMPEVEQLLDKEEKCHLSLFTESFVASDNDAVIPRAVNKTHVDVPVYDKQQQCFARCLGPEVNIAWKPNLSTTKILKTRPLLFKPRNRGSSVNILNLSKEKLPQQLNDRVITRIQKVPFKVLVSAFRSDIPVSYLDHLRAYITNPASLKVLENFNYNLYSNLGDLLRGLLLYIKNRSGQDPKLVQVISKSMPYIANDGKAAEGFQVQDVYLKTEARKDGKHESLNTIFSGIQEKCLDPDDSNLLKNILRHFKAKCKNFASNRRCMCPVRWIKDWNTIEKQQPWEIQQAQKVQINVINLNINNVFGPPVLPIWSPQDTNFGKQHIFALTPSNATSVPIHSKVPVATTRPHTRQPIKYTPPSISVTQRTTKNCSTKTTGAPVTVVFPVITSKPKQSTHRFKPTDSMYAVTTKKSLKSTTKFFPAFTRIPSTRRIIKRTKAPVLPWVTVKVPTIKPFPIVIPTVRHTPIVPFTYKTTTRSSLLVSKPSKLTTKVSLQTTRKPGFITMKPTIKSTVTIVARPTKDKTNPLLQTTRQAFTMKPKPTTTKRMTSSKPKITHLPTRKPLTFTKPTQLHTAPTHRIPTVLSSRWPTILPFKPTKVGHVSKKIVPTKAPGKVPITYPAKLSTIFIPSKVSEKDICEEIVGNIWTISSIHFDIIDVLRAIPKDTLPPSSKTDLEELYKLFSNNQINFNVYVQDFKIENYQTRGEFLVALFKYMLNNARVPIEIKKLIEKLQIYVKLDGPGAKPINIINIDSQYKGNIGVSSTTIAVDMGSLFDKLKYSYYTPKEIRTSCKLLMNFLSSDLGDEIISSFEFDMFNTKRKFLTGLLQHIKKIPKLDYLIKKAVTEIEPHLNKLYGPNELVSFSYYTDPIDDLL